MTRIFYAPGMTRRPNKDHGVQLAMTAFPDQRWSCLDDLITSYAKCVVFSKECVFRNIALSR
jgi:hypothetical protein